jgi:pimeloyl-ACP methyl ester carboxylesterase
MALSRHRFDFRAAGHRLHAERLELPGAHGIRLVFLHEGLGSISQWRDFPAELCLACDLPGLVYERWGFGHSEPLTEPRPSDYLHYEAWESLPEVLEHCGCAEAPVLIGHSDGGTIALLFAAAYPDRVKAVITEAAHVFVEEVTLVGIRAAKHAYETTDLPQRLARHHGANTEAMFRGWCDTWLRPDFRHWNIEAELSKISCPVLAIQGQQDEYGTPAQVQAIAAGVSGPVQTLLIRNCGHIPHDEARQTVLTASADFLSGVV